MNDSLVNKALFIKHHTLCYSAFVLQYCAATSTVERPIPLNIIGAPLNPSPPYCRDVLTVHQLRPLDDKRRKPPGRLYA